VYLFQYTAGSSDHLLWLLAGALVTAGWIAWGRSRADQPAQQRIGLVMSLIPVVVWLGISIYLIDKRPLRLDLILPFHVCYFLNLLMPVMLWRRSYFLFEISYFMIMAGCFQALVTPDLQTLFPHFLNVRYFTIHMGLVQSTLYAIFVFRFRPTWRSIGKAFLWANVYFVFVILVNALLGTNFMYLRQKPPRPTLLDLFGDWPWYILGAELLALVLFVVVFLPFATFRRRGS
jgi:hypothetical integral membrane protein (TIGR02206 family)